MFLVSGTRQILWCNARFTKPEQGQLCCTADNTRFHHPAKQLLLLKKQAKIGFNPSFFRGSLCLVECKQTCYVLGKGRYSFLRFVFLCSTWILHWKLSHAEIYCIGFALIFTWNTEGLFTIQGHLILDTKPQCSLLNGCL